MLIDLFKVKLVVLIIWNNKHLKTTFPKLNMVHVSVLNEQKKSTKPDKVIKEWKWIRHLFEIDSNKRNLSKTLTNYSMKVEANKKLGKKK